MEENYYSPVIKKAYEMLERITPLKKDCGKICDGKCCRGESSDGMLLFPGEEKLFMHSDGFNVYFDDRYGYYCVTCKGKCDRKNRPLACRIFPYFIYVKDEQSAPTVAPDIRAVEFCPLLKNGHKIDKKFLRTLRICAAALSSDDTVKKFLVDLTAVLTDFNDL